VTCRCLNSRLGIGRLNPPDSIWGVSSAHGPACISHRNVKRMVDALQRAVPIPQLEIMVHRAFRRQILRQRLPLLISELEIDTSKRLRRRWGSVCGVASVQPATVCAKAPESETARSRACAGVMSVTSGRCAILATSRRRTSERLS
jgi:hypothetical protein